MAKATTHDATETPKKVRTRNPEALLTSEIGRLKTERRDLKTRFTRQEAALNKTAYRLGEVRELLAKKISILTADDEVVDSAPAAPETLEA